MKVKSTLRYTSFTILKIVRDARNLTLKEVSSVLNKTSQFYSEKNIIVLSFGDPKYFIVNLSFSKFYLAQVFNENEEIYTSINFPWEKLTPFQRLILVRCAMRKY